MKKKQIRLFFILLLSFLLLTSCADFVDENLDINEEVINDIKDDVLDEVDDISDDIIDENGYYTTKEDVALYINTYNKLPNNYITKKEAYDLGWNPKEGNLWSITEKKSIGGDRFGNREGNLPIEEGRQYYECDINYNGGYRGKERIVYSNDGLIYYTEDHYNTFELLYGDE